MKAEDLNFPQAEYSPEELPASIAQLAEFIKEDQVHSEVTASHVCESLHVNVCEPTRVNIDTQHTYMLLLM